MRDIREVNRERDAAELAGVAKRRQSGSDRRESVSTLRPEYLSVSTPRQQRLGIAGLILGLIGLAFSFSLFNISVSLLAIGPTVACTATGLTLSGVAFYQALEDEGTLPGILVAGLAAGAAAIMVFIAWFGYAILTFQDSWNP